MTQTVGLLKFDHLILPVFAVWHCGISCSSIFKMNIAYRVVSE